MSKFGRFTQMPREEVQAYLECRGFAVYDSEPIDELREAAHQDEREVEVEELLLELKSEREKFMNFNESKMGDLISKLQELGEYPQETREANPNSVYDMVQGWGAYWHRWSGQLNCPECNADLRDHECGPPFMRQIGISNGDSIHTWKCPDCNHMWARDMPMFGSKN